MNFMSLDYFIMVARERSFTKAAARLHVTQQTLSTHIATLEKEIGSTLLVRHVPLELTYAGEVFYRYAVDIQRKLHSMQQEMDDIAKKEKGRLRVGIAHTRGHAIMPPILKAYQENHPMVQVQLVEASNAVLQNKLQNGELDLAIANFPDKLPGITLEDFYQEEIVLLLPDTLLHTLYGEEKEVILTELKNTGDLSRLGDCPFLMGHEEDIAGRIGRMLLQKWDVIPQIKSESDNIETLLECCVRDMGACFCPENLVRTTLSEEAVEHLHVIHFAEGTRYMIRFGSMKQSYEWSMLSKFISYAKEIMGRNTVFA